MPYFPYTSTNIKTATRKYRNIRLIPGISKKSQLFRIEGVEEYPTGIGVSTSRLSPDSAYVLLASTLHRTRRSSRVPSSSQTTSATAAGLPVLHATCWCAGLPTNCQAGDRPLCTSAGISAQNADRLAAGYERYCQTAHEAVVDGTAVGAGGNRLPTPHRRLCCRESDSVLGYRQFRSPC
jgi:hypothetical protein